MIRTLIITDSVKGTRTIRSKAELIMDQLELLLRFKNDGRRPSEHLLQDIRIYQFILNQKDPEQFATDYLNEMNRLRDTKGELVKKIEAAKKK